jgi:hypothetical protein
VSNVERYFDKKVYKKVMKDPRFSPKYIRGLIHREMMERFGDLSTTNTV